MVHSWLMSLVRSCTAAEPDRSVEDRRGAVRYPARDARAMLGWGEGEGLVIEPIKVVDISRSGLLLVSDAVPPDGSPIRLRFEDRRVAWIEAAVVRVNRTPEGPHWIRAAFLEPCPDDVLASVAGASAVIPGAPGPPPPGPTTDPGVALPPGVLGALGLLGLAWPCDQAEVQAAYRARAEGVPPDAGAALALREALESLLMACHADRSESEGPDA